MLLQAIHRAPVLFFDRLANEFINAFRALFRIIATEAGIGTHEDRPLFVSVGYEADIIRAHAVAHGHVAGDARRLLKIVAGAGRDFVEHDFFGGAPSEEAADFVEEFIFACGIAVFLGEEPCDAEGGTAGNNGNFVEGIGMGAEMAHDRMAELVVGGDVLLVLGELARALLRADRDFFHGIDNVAVRDLLVGAFCGEDRPFVHDVLEVCARKTDRLLGDFPEVDSFGHLLPLRVDLEDFDACLEIGPVEEDMPVESSRSQKRRIENIGAIGCGHDNDMGALLEAIHLREDLIERLLALVMTSAKACSSTLSPDRINLIDEDDAGGIALGACEEVTHAACANSDKHLDEFRARDGEEGHARFPRDCAGKEGFARARGSDEEDALGDLCADIEILLGTLEEVHDFHEVFLRFVASCHIFESRLHLLGIGDAGAGFAEGERGALAPGDTPKKPDDSSDDEDEEEEIGEDAEEEIGRFAVFHFDDCGILGIIPFEERYGISRFLVRLECGTGMGDGEDPIVTDEDTFKLLLRVPARDFADRYFLRIGELLFDLSCGIGEMVDRERNKDREEQEA